MLTCWTWARTYVHVSIVSWYISKNPRPGRIGKNCQKSRSYITSSSVSKSHFCAHGWQEEQGLVKLKMNFWSMSFTFFQSWSIHMRQIRFATSSSLLAIPPGRGITNLLRVYDVWSSLVYSTIYYRSLKPDGNWNFLFWFVMKSYF